MSNNFMEAMKFTMKWEVGYDRSGKLKADGGYTNDPRDPGGETKWGISKRANPDLDIKNLTLGEAIERYKRNYWDAYKTRSPPLDLDEVPIDYAVSVFDTGVNCGVGRCFSWHLKAQKEEDPTLALLGLRQEYYLGLKTFSVFGKGWINRLNDLKKLIEVLRN